MDVGEGGKRPLSSDQLQHELKAFIKAAEDVEHQSAVLHGLAEVGKRVCHGLHFPAEIINGEGSLAGGAELGVEEHGAGFAVVEEVLLVAKPRCSSADAIALVNNVEKVGGDGVEDPRDNDAVHVGPGRVVETGGVVEDVVLQSEPSEDKEDVAAPFGVIGGLQVKDDGDQVPDILQGGGLAVQVNNGRGLRGDGARVVVGDRVVVAEGLSAKSLPKGRCLPLQGVALRALQGKRKQGIGWETGQDL